MNAPTLSVLPVVLAVVLTFSNACASSRVEKDNRTGALAGHRLECDVYGNLYLLNQTENTLKLYSKEQVLQRTVGGPGWLQAQFDQPWGIWARNGIDVFVADYGNHRIQRFDRTLNFVSSFSTRESANPDERFGYPTDVALSRQGDLFVCDGENSRVVKINRFSRVERTFGGFDAGRGRLHMPVQLETGPRDRVYVLDGRRVVVFDSFGNYLRDCGEGLLDSPAHLFADADGVVILDSASLHWFDEEDRHAGSVPLLGILDEDIGRIRSVVLVRGMLYLLSEKGMTVTEDPRTRSEKKLDKEGKSH